MSSYDDFIFSFREKQKEGHLNLACQNRLNDITVINEYCLFISNNDCDCKALKGNDYAVPISTELLHERNGHSKKVKKNRRQVSPAYFYTRTSLKKADVEYRKIDEDKEEEGEAGLLVEYFIKYQNDKINKKLKNNHYLGKIIQNVNLFTSRNFKELKEEIDKISSDKEKKTEKEGHNNGYSDKIKVKNIIPLPEKNKNNLYEEELSKKEISDYEKEHLFNGKYFVYPDSLPINYITIIGKKKDKDNNNDMKMIEEKNDYIEKYKNAIMDGRKSHYGEDN